MSVPSGIQHCVSGSGPMEVLTWQLSLQRGSQHTICPYFRGNHSSMQVKVKVRVRVKVRGGQSHVISQPRASWLAPPLTLERVCYTLAPPPHSCSLFHPLNTSTDLELTDGLTQWQAAVSTSRTKKTPVSSCSG